MKKWFAGMLVPLLLMGCSGGDFDRAEAEPARAGEGAPHVVADSMTAMGHGGVTGMGHDSISGMDHGSMSGMDHGSMSGMDHGSMPAAGEGMTGVDHSGMAMDGRSRGEEPMDHAGMNMGQESTEAPADVVSMDHAQMGHAAASPEAPGMDHPMAPGKLEAPATRGATPQARAPVLLPGDSGTEKLLTLVRQLVRDPAVQQQIQKDPVLREAWTDPGVRDVILRHDE